MHARRPPCTHPQDEKDLFGMRPTHTMLTSSALHHDPQAFSLADPSTSSLQAKPLHSSTFLGLPGSYPASHTGLREESA